MMPEIFDTKAPIANTVGICIQIFITISMNFFYSKVQELDRPFGYGLRIWKSINAGPDFEEFFIFMSPVEFSVTSIPLEWLGPSRSDPTK